MVVPPIQRGAVPVAWRGEREERRVVCSRGGEHAHTQREREGGATGRAIVAWLGAVRVVTLPSLGAWVMLGGVARLPFWWWGWVGGNDFPR